jgi:hypothetical protein
MHQINARAKRETLVEKKGTTKKKTSEMETEREGEEKPTYIKQEKTKENSCLFLLFYCISQNVLIQFVSE